MSKINHLYVATVEYAAEQKQDAHNWFSLIDYDVVAVCTQKVSHGPENGWEKVAIDFDCKCGDTVYLLVLRYTQGDSFGTSKGNTEILGIFKDKQFATETLQVLDTDLKNKSNKNITFTTESGIEVSIVDFTKEYFCAYEKIDLIEKKISL